MKKHRALLASLLISTGILFVGTNAHAAIADDFSSNSSGWQLIDLQGSGNYTTVIGTQGVTYNSGGYISATDPSNYSFYFDAPDKYTGNLSAYSGGTLSFDTFYTTKETASAWRDDADIVLTSGSTHLVWQAASNPGTDWAHVSVVLGVSQGWKIGSISGSNATAADIANALSNVTALRIRGEYANGLVETTALDNVVLAPVPEPETWAMLVAGLGLIGALRRRKSGN